MIAELARLGAATAGAADKVWLLERLHADALLLPLAYLVRHGCSWDLLGEAFRYNKREIQTRLQTEAIHDPGVCWALVRMLQRGRYNRFVALHASDQWKSFGDSVKVCSVPDWWSPPWTVPHKQHQSDANRGRRPLLPKEWDQRRRTRSPFPTRVSGAQIAVTRDPSRPRQSHVKPAVSPAVRAAPCGPAAKKRRGKRGKQAGDLRVDFLPKPPKLLLCECWP